jgi:hypothetical protein
MKFRQGEHVRVAECSGIDSGKEGVVMSREIVPLLDSYSRSLVTEKED